MTSDSENCNSEPEEIINPEAQDSRKKYECTFAGCKAAFVRPNKLKYHLNVHNERRSFKCEHKGCDKSYFNSSHLKRHMQSHSIAKQTFECNICHVNISTATNLKRHYNRAHANKKLYCEKCDLKFRKKHRFEEHMASHENKSLYQCDQCERQFITRLKFVRHQQCHKNKMYKCTVDNCLEVFEKWALMQKHKKIKHKFIEHICKVCNKVFSNKANYKLHTLIHSENRPAIPCPYENCNRLYYFKRNLNLHIKSYHKGKKFDCDICGAKLSSKSKIRNHIIALHQSEKNRIKRKAQQPRKDIGIARKTLLSQLSGVQLSVNVEKQLMNRKPAALIRDIEAEHNSSFSEDDRASDFSAKGA